jgi:FtsP/CotA-like multicopper oxidase with cupredoxin domain/Cu/Ag efflux protein CusF
MRPTRTLAPLLALAMYCSGARTDPPSTGAEQPPHTRFGLTSNYRQGGDADRDAYEAQLARVPGVHPLAVETRPGEVHFRLEVFEIQEEIYPGEFVTFWVYAPLGSESGGTARLPSPTLRVEQGERVKITLYNTHYLPHTIHLHGMSQSIHMDGMSDMGHDVLPGEQFTYEFVAKHPGTYFYHCHVQEQVHIPMGLAGMFIVEQRRPNNHFARIVPGAGHISSMSKATLDNYDAEYSLVYMDIDDRLNRIPAFTNDVREIEWRMHHDYDGTQRVPSIFLLNGRSYPFTLRDSPINVAPNQRVKLRVLNAGPRSIFVHAHGHHPTITDVDGFEIPADSRLMRDTIDVGPSQRVDLLLETHNDGFRSAGPGMWMIQDHGEGASTNRGIAPGGSVGFINYSNAPSMDHSAMSRYFDPRYYREAISTFSPNQSTTMERPVANGALTLDYPRRAFVRAQVPRLDIIDAQRHTTVASSCKGRPRTFRRISLKAGRAHARAGEAFGFSPRQLRLGRCEAVELTLENEDQIRHHVMIPGLNPMFAVELLGPAKTMATFVTPDTDVTLQFHCHVPAHDKVGMFGEIIVGRGGPPVLTANPATTTNGFVKGTGTIVAVLPRMNRLIVNHDEIAGVMAPMEMSFNVVDSIDLTTFSPGARISFLLHPKVMQLHEIVLVELPNN